MKTTYTRILRDRGERSDMLLRSNHITPKCAFGSTYVQPLPHLDQSDDDYEFVNDNLQRWHDRQFR